MPRTAARAAKPEPRVTHPERVIDKTTGVTKGELIAYYGEVSALMLPHLKQRPVAMLRAPAGIAAFKFFQKHAEPQEMPALVQLDPALDPEHEPMLAIDSARGIASAAQMNVVEFHTWNATVRNIGKPDRIVFDLDPGKGVGWPQLRESTRAVRDFLSELGLTSFCKTSGGNGLHVVVPIAPRNDWDTVRGFSRAVVQHLSEAAPERFVAKSGPANRVGRIFIDYLRNGFGATTVCAWSARARPGLGVSVPVAWEELDDIGGAAHWNVRSVAPRMKVGDAPWGAYATTRNPLAPAMRALKFDPKAAA